MTHKLNAARTAAVSLDAVWRPIDADTPRGVKMLLINQDAGVAHIGLRGADNFYTHWHALPKFSSEETK